MKRIVPILILIFTGNISLALSPNDKDTGRKLICPAVETTALMGTPEVIYEMKNGQLYIECGYFVKESKDRWSSVITVKAYWVEKETAEQFDCNWKGKEDPIKYIISDTKQAYSDVVTYRRDFYHLTFDVQKDLFDQVVSLALDCPLK